jgi:hypothetical protein
VGDDFDGREKEVGLIGALQPKRFDDPAAESGIARNLDTAI